MELILLGLILALTGGVLFYRLRKSEAEDGVLQARLQQADALYQAIRYEPDNERWAINKARNDVYFRRLDVRFKSWNPVWRGRLYVFSTTLILSGGGLVVFMLFQLGVFK